PQQLHKPISYLGLFRVAQADEELNPKGTVVRKPLDLKLQTLWTPLLGLGHTLLLPDPKATSLGKSRLTGMTVDRLRVETEPGVTVPALLLIPAGDGKPKVPVVVAVSQHGKEAFLRHRADDIARLLVGGVAVCLPDVRGTGETRPANDRRGPPAGMYADVARNS